ncbi:ABC transporter ATP-binding protein [Acrocarpospora pleiomorpha]|uniref:ABC transporter ATP-binding protein n=1 Tax=Acrocarpospora pleiomorpha TaxID=90975 RepID=A0A5M3XIF5_9ACTN|nr:ABC transporter ATP-binding protein [Acrocarpospora pleiomorpha]GES20730.1 ABC transporter ATP-binding protein [Acrocarpospora pleiomorpha]
MTISPAAPLLQVRDAVVEYTRTDRPAVRALAGVSFQVAEGEMVGVVGESGCGKSTLARAMTGLAPLASGEILFAGRPVEPLRRRRRPARLLPLQMIFQDPYASLNPRRRISAQLADVIRATGKGAPGHRPIGDLLERVGLPAAAADRYPHEFSGGQRQRIAIARALATQPSLIVADEPVSALDASAQAQVATLLRKIAREDGVTLVLISHDLAVVGALCDRVVVMYLGEIVEDGPTERVWHAPRHPYTQSLLRAVPVPDGTGRKPMALAGEVPDPGRPPSGCRFHPRCPLAMDPCREEAPSHGDVDGGGSVACWAVHSPEARANAIRA